MVDFSDNIPNNLPKLPDNYWETQRTEKKQEPIFYNSFNIKASLDDITNEISIFKTTFR